MRIVTALLLLFISMVSNAQTTYYTTDGANRFTEDELREKLTEISEKLEGTTGKKTYTSVSIENTEIKQDSVIAKIILNLADTKPDSLFTIAPLAEHRNKAFPTWVLTDLAGESFDLASLRGKPTMINFWFTRCAPCIDEMPVLNIIMERYAGEVNFVSVTFEKQKDVAKFLKKHSFHFLHLVDANDFIRHLGITSYPKNLFLDKNAILRYVKGGIPYEETEDGEVSMGMGNEVIEIIEELR